MDKTTELIKAVASLIAALSWPLLVLFLVLFFSKSLKKFLDDLGEFTFKADTSGLEASAKRQQIEAAASLGAASVRSESGTVKDVSAKHSISSGQTAKDIADIVTQSVKPRAILRLAGASVLWVDDNPNNNVYQRSSLEALGIRFVLSTSTDDALQQLKRNNFDVIISDMGRQDDKTAGLTLLEKLRELKVSVPLIINGGQWGVQNSSEALQRGAFGVASNPQDLFQLVLQAIQQ